MTSTVDVKGQGHRGLVKVELRRENGLTWRQHKIGSKKILMNQIAFKKKLLVQKKNMKRFVAINLLLQDDEWEVACFF